MKNYKPDQAEKNPGPVQTAPRQPLEDESGAILVVVMLLLMVMIALVPVAVRSTSTDINRTKNYEEDRTAFYLAEAGVEHTKSYVRGKEFSDYLNANGLISEASNVVTSWSDANNTYNFTEVDGHSSGFDGKYLIRVVDNEDGDGNLWADTDNVILVDAVGISDKGTTKRIQSKVYRNNLGMDLSTDFPAAVTMVDTEVEIDPDGNAFSVDGSGVIPNSSPPLYAEPDPNCTSKYAVASQATGADFDTSHVAANEGDNFYGLGGTPSFNEGDTTLSISDMQKLRTRVLSISGVQTVQNSISTGTLGTASDPGIFHIPDHFTGQGDVVGHGILVVDRDFHVLGNFEWHGLIITGVCPTCDGRIHNVEGNSKVYGAVVAGNATSSHSGETRLEIRGNAMFYYSCSALDAVQKAVQDDISTNFKSVSWREVPYAS